MAKDPRLHEIAEAVTALEEQHNVCLDNHEIVGERVSRSREEARMSASHLRTDIRALREELRIRLERITRAATLLSLIAQQDELAPIRARIQNQPYEQYVESAWMRKRLTR